MGTEFCVSWDAPGGPYLHQGEGPRGWITPQSLSSKTLLDNLHHTLNRRIILKNIEYVYIILFFNY